MNLFEGSKETGGKSTKKSREISVSKNLCVGGHAAEWDSAERFLRSTEVLPAIQRIPQRLRAMDPNVAG